MVFINPGQMQFRGRYHISEYWNSSEKNRYAHTTFDFYNTSARIRLSEADKKDKYGFNGVSRLCGYEYKQEDDFDE